ncbi:MAG: hypothetical protein CL917_09115 [Deltaproteobacteria bacterium]|nr:hypothetical protein [Deltaproteobacteria bacterium]
MAAKAKASAKPKAKAKAKAKTSLKAKVASSAKAKSSSTPAKAASTAKAAKPNRATNSAATGKLYYRIGEVSNLTGVKPHVLRYWETEFRWMAPPKSRSKQRLYRQKDIEMVKAIKALLYEKRYTIAGARQKLRELGLSGTIEAMEEASPPATETTAGPKVEAIRAQYRDLRRDLMEIRDLL